MKFTLKTGNGSASATRAGEKSKPGNRNTGSSDSKNAAANRDAGERRVTLPSLLLSLLLFISMFFVIRLILPHLYEWGFDYGAVKGFFVPVTVGVTLFLGYLAERKLNVYLVQQLHKLFSLKGKKKR